MSFEAMKRETHKYKAEKAVAVAVESLRLAAWHFNKAECPKWAEIATKWAEELAATESTA